MKEKGLVNFFEEYLAKKPIFIDKNILQSNYTPETIPHREEQVTSIAQILAPILRNEKPSNVFIYGKTGTGKTLTIKYTTQQLESIAKQKQLPIKVIYLNCKLKKLADTEYRLIAQVLRDYGKNVPATGLPTDEIYHFFYTELEKEPHSLILVLDEIDQLVGKAGDELLYNLTRINSELKKTQITLVGISNDLLFIDRLDPRVKSSLSQEEIIFPPYNAIQIQEILQQRAQKAFREGTLEQGLLEKCAAFAAREHGDARRALELLRVAGELAERENQAIISIKHLDIAEEKIEKDRILDTISHQPKQFQITLLAIINACEKRKGVFTGEVYSLYEKYCEYAGISPLTQRRVSDLIAELDMLGVINAAIISKGRYGRTREISLSIPETLSQKVKQIISIELGISWNS